MAQKVNTLEIKNFVAFKEIKTELSPHINIVIGENSTGKTFLLKVIYYLFKVAAILNGRDTNSPEFQARNVSDLRRVFDPRSNLESLQYFGTQETASLEAKLCGGNVLRAFTNPKIGAKAEIESPIKKYEASVLIPSKELMYFLPDLSSVAKDYDLIIDQTFEELLNAMARPNLLPNRIHEPAKTVLENIEKLIGGKFYLAPDGTMRFSNEGWAKEKFERSANVIAEGYRKFGILARLLESGTVNPGNSGPLLWDEPETNLNPKLMRSLVEMLRDLARGGQQVILTTHNYVILKWFHLLLQEDKDLGLCYIHLFRDNETNEINALTTNDYNEVFSNAISDAYSSMTDFQLSKVQEKYIHD